KVVPERIADIVKGIAQACAEAGTALLGGETAEHPGLLSPDEYDVAGSTTGVVEAEKLLGPELVREGDVVIAMASSGLHSNGYSLVRHVFFTPSDQGGAGWALDREVPELGRTLGEELLTPTRLYTLPCLALAAEVEVHAMSHITGGGLAANLARVLPNSVSVRLDRSSWSPHPIFGLVGSVGGVSQDDLDLALNMGVGMVALVAPDAADAAIRLLDERGVSAWVAGDVAAAGVHGAGGTVTLEGAHA
ncbi:MAG: phosphoribosylformylglycinamidine cyclo-ligase, partial [Nocardioidaceae bacterium]|nr:phosphoribosylformylglycinamidine cyclo-ligase [Nocardioidaceae bacterium]